MDLSLLSHLVLVIALVTALVALFLVFFQGRAIKHKMDQFEAFLHDLDSVRDLHKKQLVEIQSGTLGLGKKLVDLQHHLSQLQDQQLELKLKEPENRLYSRAMRMAELGADLDELIKECELPRAEAELLLSLHRERMAAQERKC